MASRAWTAFERLVASLSGGQRTWGDADRIDVQTAGDDVWAIECKWLKAPTIADVERILAYNQTKADKRGMKNALVIKRKAGRGRPTPVLVVAVLATEEEQLGNGNQQ